MKQRIKLNEKQLMSIIRETINETLNERVKTGQPMTSDHEKKFIGNHTQRIPNGGVKWTKQVSESRLNSIIGGSIKKVLNENINLSILLI